MGRIYTLLIAVASLVVFFAAARPVQAIIDCEGEGGTCYRTSSCTCSLSSGSTNCGSGSRCCWGTLTCPTPTPRPPTPTPVPPCDPNAWGSCSTSACGACGTKWNDCGDSLPCCNAPCPTATPRPTATPTPIPTPTPTPIPNACSINYESLTRCSSTTVEQICKDDGSGTLKWLFNNNCFFTCADPTTKCNPKDGSVGGTCCPDPNTEYCANYCSLPSCSPPSGGTTVLCWRSKADYDADLAKTKYYRPDCLVIANCQDCHPIWDTCGGDARCDLLYPGQGLVSHIDSCNGIGCGAPCAATPTPTPTLLPTPTGGGGGGGCVETGPFYGAWGSCSGSPATKSRTVSYSCQASTTETTSCYGTIRARAVVVAPGDTGCAAIQSSTTGVPGATIGFAPSSASRPTPQAQSGASYATFSSVAGGTYTVDITVSPDYVARNACWAKLLNTPTSGTGLSQYLSVPTNSDTLTWNVGYTQGTPWVQTEGGNVYAAASLKSFVGSSALPRQFLLAGSGGYPGVATYGTSYDFDSSLASQGETLVSPANWLVTQSVSSINYYELFWRRFGGGTTPDSFPDLAAVAKPASRTTPYYVVGDMTTSGNWTVPNGDTIIFLVNGNLTLGGKVNIVGSGFAAFIVSGNITVDSSVGGPSTSDNPVIEGVYVTSPTGTFQTGTSSVANKERLVGQGIFVAGGFLLERDLDSVNANPTTAAELFLYNPRLLFTMPDSMRDVPITWEEVAP